MKQCVFLFFLFFCSHCAIGQQESAEIKRDTVKHNLKQSIRELLFPISDSVGLKAMKEVLVEITPKPLKMKRKIGWIHKGKTDLLFNQSAFNMDWQGGGASNIAGNLNLNYEFNYQKGSLTWDNKVLADFGLTFLKGESFSRKTNDRIELNSILGQKIKKTLWNYSVFMNFRSQFAKGYSYTKDIDTEETIRTEETHLFSPAFVQLGPGFLWKKSDDLSFNISPLTSRMIFVNSKFTSIPEYEDKSYFGVETGKSSRFEFGGAISFYSKLKVWNNFTVENTLNLYSNYIEDPYNIDIDYLLNLNLVFNKYITGSVVFQAIYDDNTTSAFQIREIIGLGLTYGF